MLLDVDDVLAGLSSCNFRERGSTRLAALTRKEAAGSSALGVAEPFPLSVGEVVGAGLGLVGPGFGVSPAHLWSSLIDPTAVVAHRRS
jgi:hypothetical protein